MILENSGGRAFPCPAPVQHIIIIIICITLHGGEGGGGLKISSGKGVKTNKTRSTC